MNSATVLFPVPTFPERRTRDPQDSFLVQLGLVFRHRVETAGAVPNHSGQAITVLFEGGSVQHADGEDCDRKRNGHEDRDRQEQHAASFAHAPSGKLPRRGAADGTEDVLPRDHTRQASVFGHGKAFVAGVDHHLQDTGQPHLGIDLDW